MEDDNNGTVAAAASRGDRVRRRSLAIAGCGGGVWGRAVQLWLACKRCSKRCSKVAACELWRLG